MLLGRQGRREGFKGSLGRREGFKGSVVSNVAFWNQKKIFKKAPGRWPQDMLQGRQGRREGFKGSLGRREGFKGSLVPNVASWNQKKISQESARQVAIGAAGPPRAPMLLGRQGRLARFKGSLGRREGFKVVPNVAFWNQKKIFKKAPGRWPKHMLLGRLVPNVAFWNQKKIFKKAPGRWPKHMLLGRQGRPCCWRHQGKGLRAA